ncbi:MAG: glycosyltransferase family 9 protein [Acidobacteriaceae bacterium]|nr:glycosyltransferase family 9 protein [Acidobacteriaceae bacterium]MBV9294214.1 glycosyltransferase family 9 protein [Acidobacteriaceae bacterium]MBV9766435.1 glycosyltransferase family 9 protein [Acidobacteriaceae bacterium]
MTVLEQLPERSRVAIIRLRSLGDCVLTTPALSLLKRARPDLEIGVAVEAPFTTVFEGLQSVSAILAPAWRVVRAWRPSLCVNLHGGNRSQWITAFSGAKWRAGFAHHSMTLAYNFKIPRAQRILYVNRVVHTAEHLASAFFALGVPISDVPRAELSASDSPIQGRYAVFHPFASAPEKEWPAERFCEVARYLKLWNITPVFLVPPGVDPSPFRAHDVFQGTLSQAKAVLSKASAFIGNDSGPAHIAAAFGVPSVVLFSTSNPAIWGPWRTESQIIVAPEGLQTVNVSRVITAVERLRTLEKAHA